MSVTIPTTSKLRVDALLMHGHSWHEHMKYKCGIRLLLKRIYEYINLHAYLPTHLLHGAESFFRS